MINIKVIPNKDELRQQIVADLQATNRDGMEQLITYMDEVKFFDAPASGGNHMAKDGGLAEHSYNVYRIADMMALGMMDFQSYCEIQNSIVIAAYLHDLGKCGHMGKAFYTENILKSGVRSDAKPFKTNEDILYIPHEVISIAQITQRIELTEDEYFAILYHNGLYGDFKYTINGKETLLYLLIHSADMFASRIVEKGDKQ